MSIEQLKRERNSALRLALKRANKRSGELWGYAGFLSEHWDDFFLMYPRLNRIGIYGLFVWFLLNEKKEK